jgi:RimJ/RimL family protein N-acetyltransferase
LVRYGFAEVGLERIFAETLLQNERSRAIMTVLGMQFERAFRHAFADDPSGCEQDAVVYAITRAEWADRRADR